MYFLVLILLIMTFKEEFNERVYDAEIADYINIDTREDVKIK